MWGITVAKGARSATAGPAWYRTSRAMLKRRDKMKTAIEALVKKKGEAEVFLR